MPKNPGVLVSVTMDRVLKEGFSALCSSCGVSESSAVRMLAEQTIEEQGLPFLVKQYPAWEKKFSGEIVKTSFYLDRETKAAFKTACHDDVGMSMSQLIKAFMLQSWASGEFPCE